MHHEPVWARHHAELGGLEVEVLMRPAVNLALVHNRVLLVSSVTVRNVGDQPQVYVTVSVSLHGQGRELADPWSRPTAASCWRGGEHLERLRCRPSGARPSGGLNESHPAALRVVASRTWGDDVELPIALNVLAHNEWFNSPIFFASLASFVQPNTRAVRAVLDGAAELLRKATGSASLSGYQDGPERAAEIAAAVYAALHARGVRYVNPPASFEWLAQKIGTTAHRGRLQRGDMTRR